MNEQYPTMAGSADRLYQAALELVFRYGRRVSPRGLPTRELLGPTFILADARNNVITIPDRKLNYSFSVAEWLWMLLGRNDVASISFFNSRIKDFSDDGVTFQGAYGVALKPQLGYVVETLSRDPDSRQAVMTFWRPSPGPSKDIPCTVSLHFLLRDGRLHAHGYMRSNDAWLGFPYDLFNFTRIQAYVAALLNVGVGAYRHTVGSFHLYDKDLVGARVVQTSRQTQIVTSPTLSPYPKDFERLFETLAGVSQPDDRELVARHLDPTKLPEPWGLYASILAYWTHRDASRVLPPYDKLLAKETS